MGVVSAGYHEHTSGGRMSAITAPTAPIVVGDEELPQAEGEEKERRKKKEKRKRKEKGINKEERLRQGVALASCQWIGRNGGE